MPANPAVRDWVGRRIWLIGASSGIGAALGRELLARGARVALTARNAAALAEVAAGQGEAALILNADATRADELEACAARIDAAWGGFDLVVTLAGTYEAMRADAFDLAVARRMMETNVGSVHNALAAVLPRLLRQGHGGIGIVASVAGYRGLPQALGYGPTKAALINMAEVLYLDLAPRGLAVYLISPGFVKTPLTAANPFHMPALIEPRDAALAIMRGIEAGRFSIDFPRRFTRILALLRFLPARWYFALVHRATGL